MTDGVPTLEIGFAISTEESFNELAQLQRAMSTAEAAIIADAASIERATGNMVNLGSPIAAVKSFGNATTREYRSIARERAAAEKTGEALVRQLTREASTFGMTKAEIRATKVETAALAAEQAGLTELAGRLRSQQEALVAAHSAAAAAVEREAQAIREAAFAHQMFEARARQGAQAIREQEAAARSAAAAEADLATRAQRLVASVNPAAAAQQRFNAEMAEARTLISAGAISLDDYVAKLRMEQAALDGANDALLRGGASAGAHRQAMMGASYQVQDFITQVSMGANPINAFAVQGAQLAGQFANVGGKAGAVASFFMGPWGLAITAAALGIGMLTKGMFDNVEANKALQVAADNTSSAQSVLGQMFDLTTGKIINNTQAIRDNIYAQMQAFTAQSRKSRMEADTALEDAGVGRTTPLGRAVQRLGAYASWTGRGATIEEGLARQEAQARSYERLVQAVAAGMPLETAGSLLDRKALGDQKYEDLQQALNLARDSFTAGQSARQMQRSLDTGTLDRSLFKPDTSKPDKPKTNRHAESLQRDAEATEAQIKNLYALVDAYNASGAAALIAEARVKAESDAIKKRGDIEAIVSRQVQVAIAQRVADAAKSTATMRDQVRIQNEVNAQVAAGNVPAERAAELVQNRLADLPLLQAAEAAQQRGLKDEAMKAMTALADQQAVREEMRKSEEQARFNSSQTSGNEQLAMLREELRLIGATNRERNIALATIKATQEAERQFSDPAMRQAYIDQQREIATTTEDLADAQREYNDALNFTADKWDLIARNVQDAARSMADAFGSQGRAIGDIAAIYTDFRANQERAQATLRENLAAANSEAAKQREIAKYNLATQNMQIGMYGDMANAAKGFFKEGSDGYKAMAAAEKAFAIVQLANTAVNVAAGAAKMFATLGPWAFPAVAAMIGVMASLGFASGGKSNEPAPTNTGTGTVLGDSAAQSESITRAINQLREVDTLMLGYSRQMAGSLRTIEDNIAGFASLLVRNADGLNASVGVKEGFNTSTLGNVLSLAPFGVLGEVLKKIPVIGGIVSGIQGVIKGLFGTKTTVIGSGLFGDAQSLGDILAGGYDAQVYSDIKKKKKFFGISAGTKYSTQYGAADPMLENQFTLILKSFNDAILAAAGPLGSATNEIQQRLNGFVLNIGKIDLQGLTGEQIEEKLTAVFGAAADSMAQAAFPGIERFQTVGEGLFETLVRVSSTVEAVTASLDMLGRNTVGMSIDVKMALSDQFDSVSDFTDAVGSYFSAFYTKEEQAAARMGQMTKVFEGLGLTMPASLAAFRALVEAQDLNTEAGRAAYATLLQLAPAFGDLQAAMAGAKTAADIASERADLERQMLELRGDTAALRALQLAKLDASNRALQQEIWAMQDAQAAAKAADELRKAWQGVSDSIMEEVRRIRGLTAEGKAGTYAALMGQFNVATTAARGGDIDAAKTLPQLSQALLAAAQDQARTRAELDRIRAQIAASLELTNGLVAAPASNTALLDAAAASQPVSNAAIAAAANETTASVDELRAETATLRAELTAALATIAASTAKTARKLEDVTAQSGGDAISTVPAA